MTVHLRTKYRLAQMQEHASLGITRRKSAELLGITYQTATIIDRKAGVKRPYDRSGWAHITTPAEERSKTMAALYRAGYTLEQIGAQFSITRERVRQLLKKYQRMTGDDGGSAARARAAQQKRRERQDAKYLASHGCTWDQYVAVRDIGRQMVRNGIGVYRTPLRAFLSQRRNAAIRGIGWELNFWQWWTIWQQSGHWDDRGRGTGYVMCREGDTGPYAVGNVFIDTAANNSSEGQRYKKLDPSLPVGVRKTNSGRYSAHRRIANRDCHLGVFDTPELAHAAYLRSLEPDFEAPTGRPGWAPSGTRGYYFKRGRYYAYVYVNSKQVYLGAYATAEAARAAHLNAKLERSAA